MSRSLQLPLALLDLTLLRAAARLQPIALPQRCIRHTSVWKRYGHAAALLAQYGPQKIPDPPLMDPSGSAYMKIYRDDENRKSALSQQVSESREVSELEERVSLLKEVINSEQALSSASSYSEDELLQLYEDLLAPAASSSNDTPRTITGDPSIAQEEDEIVIQTVARRLLDHPDSSSVFSMQQEPWRAVILRLQEIMAELDKLRLSLTSPDISHSDNNVPADIPTGTLTKNEWQALTRTCISANDGSAAETVLGLMKQYGAADLEGSVNDVLSFYASSGNITGTERLLRDFAPSSRSQLQQDLHITTHVKGISHGAFPSAALSLLHHYESKGTPAPQKSYTRVIDALLNTRDTPALAHAQAWDLFSHMRYAAHPYPDTACYTLMIQACAHPAVPTEPERALDLFTEMTVDRHLAPTQGAYIATINVLARSGKLRYVHEAFRLTHVMLDSHRDARGRSAFKPNPRLFNALLEGAKRIKDLTRARWILAEMVRETLELETAGNQNEVIITEKTMWHIFQAYSTYDPPFKRSATRVVDGPGQSHEVSGASAKSAGGGVPVGGTTHASASVTYEGSSDSEVMEDFMAAALSSPNADKRFSYIPPQTHAEVVTEADILFNRIVADSHTQLANNDVFSEDRESDVHGTKPFRHVRLTARLLNSYLLVHYAHSSLEVSSKLYRTLFDAWGVPRNATTYVEILERCTTSRKDERAAALKLAQEVWVDWQSVEDLWASSSGTKSESTVGSTAHARLVERAHVAMIRLLTLTGNLQRAVDHVKEFSVRYPPEALMRIPGKDALRSTRTVLEGARPLVRLTSAVDIPDDSVPPILTFTELEILHHRLLTAGDEASLKFITWLCRTYQGHLRRRRDATMRMDSQ